VSMFASLRLFLEYHAHVMQARNKTAPVHLLRTAGSVAEADNVGAVLPQPGLEGQPLSVIDQRDIPGFAIRVIAHQDCQFAADRECSRAVADELSVAAEEVVQCWRA